MIDGMSTAMVEASYGVMSNRLKPLRSAPNVRNRPTLSLKLSSNKQCFQEMKQMLFFSSARTVFMIFL